MRASNPSTGRSRVTSTSNVPARNPPVVRQTRASAARAAAAREHRHSTTTDDVDESDRWRYAPAPPAEDAGAEEWGQLTDDNLAAPASRGVPTRTPPLLPPVRQPPPQRLHASAGQRDNTSTHAGVRVALPRDSGGLVGSVRDRPSTVARALQTNPDAAVTAKGRAIQKDMDDLADAFFGEAYSQPPTTSGTAAFPARHRRAYEEASGPTHSDAAADRSIPRSWRVGPVDPQGRFFDSSDRNLLCMDVLLASSPVDHTRTPNRIGARGTAGVGGANVAVVGSADHGLRVFDLDTGKERKHLYTKTCGHTEWVTACRFLSDGRVLSGGMDSKLCLWDSVLRGGPARCQDLLAHTGSISQIEVDRAGDTAMSASYDRTVRIWSLGGGVGRDLGCLAGHKGPVTQFDWRDSIVLSGDRQGTAKVWDVPTATCLLTCATKRGQIGALGHFDLGGGPTLSLIGDQGGVLTVLDARQGKKPVHQSEVHPGGVVSGIQETARYIVTCGADKRICVLDPRADFAPVHEWTDHRDFIYSLKSFGPLVLSGSGNGWLLVHDTVSGECLYGLGASVAAVREICPSDRYLVAAGDDGKAVVYDFN